MYRIEKLATAGLAAAILAFALAACQPQEAARPVSDSAAPETAAPAGALTVAEVRELVVGHTVIARDEGRKVSRAEYFSPDGAVVLNAKPDAFGMIFSYDGTYYFDDRERFCANYPSLPVSQKEYCEYVVPLGDGRHELTDGSIYEQVLDGEQLDALK